MAITLNLETARQMGGGMNIGRDIKLPFHAPLFWVVNGDSRLKAQNNALYFGGWAVKMTDVQEAQRDWGIDFLPGGFVDGEVVPAQGDPFQAHLVRNLLVAPIGLRIGWIGEGMAHHAQYQAGARQHVQALVFVGSREKGGMIPWGPAVLSAKGYQAGNVVKAFKDWERHTAAARKTAAPGVPAWAFYLSVGTFGKERVAISVGKSSKSPITPIGAYLPESMDEKLLESLFVGEEIAKEMVTYLADAGEWLNAWAKLGGNGNVQSIGGGPEFDDFIPDQPGEDVPF
ncbi:MAG TPA: hypothetical protein VIH16_03650 [Bellilinea sp.]